MMSRPAHDRAFRVMSMRCVSLAVILLLASLTGCSSFNRRWDALAKPQPVAPSGQRWEGQWHSEVTDHEGALRCIIEPQADGRSLFMFSATWGPGIVSDYDIQMKVTSQPDGGESFEGEMDLGWLMGVYRCKGTIIGETFDATYESSQDHGTFKMVKVR